MRWVFLVFVLGLPLSGCLGDGRDWDDCDFGAAILRFEDDDAWNDLGEGRQYAGWTLEPTTPHDLADLDGFSVDWDLTPGWRESDGILLNEISWRPPWIAADAVFQMADYQHAGWLVVHSTNFGDSEGGLTPGFRMSIEPVGGINVSNDQMVAAADAFLAEALDQGVDRAAYVNAFGMNLERYGHGYVDMYADVWDVERLYAEHIRPAAPDTDLADRAPEGWFGSPYPRIYVVANAWVFGLSEATAVASHDDGDAEMALGSQGRVTFTWDPDRRVLEEQAKTRTIAAYDALGLGIPLMTDAEYFQIRECPWETT